MNNQTVHPHGVVFFGERFNMSSKNQEVTIRTPSGFWEIIRTFGDINDPDFYKKNIVLIKLPYDLVYSGKPVKRTQCHKLLADTFVRVFETILSEKLQDEAREFGGIYADRPIRGYPKYPSTHSWGIAIDLEPTKNPLGSKGKMHKDIVRIFKDHGFSWGGDFKYRLDPMHFQFAKNY